MAVPRADDGSLTPTPSTSGSRLTFLSAGLALVVAACAVILLVHTVSSSDATESRADDPAAREQVMNQANQFVLRVNTYGPEDLDEQNAMPEYAERVREVITAKFAVDFNESITFAEQTVAQAGYARDVEIFSSGVETIDADSASVLVAGALNGSYPDPQREGRIEYEPQPFRFQVSLVRTGDEWLVDDFFPLTGELDEPAPEQTTVPSTTPRPTGQPSGTPTGSPSEHPRATSLGTGDAVTAPSWYDVLGLAPDASSEEVRAAWRAAIVDLDPTDRRFRSFNAAAEVLLDPARRATHDAELAGANERAVRRPSPRRPASPGFAPRWRPSRCPPWRWLAAGGEARERFGQPGRCPGPWARDGPGAGRPAHRTGPRGGRRGDGAGHGGGGARRHGIEPGRAAAFRAAVKSQQPARQRKQPSGRCCPMTTDVSTMTAPPRSPT